MLKDCNWVLDADYKNGTENEPLQFYLDGLNNSNEFSLLLGYFSSSAINLVSIGFATFISKGGKMKLVINQFLSTVDKNMISKAEENPDEIPYFDLSDVTSLTNTLDKYDKHFFECLAYLISQNRIQIKIIKPKDVDGISHFKLGVFSDGIDYIGYRASCNFTLYGLTRNLEDLEAIASWTGPVAKSKILNRLNDIDCYINETDTHVEYLTVKNIVEVIKDKFSGKDINELLVQEKDLLNEKYKLIKNPKIKIRFEQMINELEVNSKIPKFPFSEGPRKYQIEAYNNWANNNFKGIFAMATGTGKTITSLNCLLNEYKLNGIYRALILVPTKSLVEQWHIECRKFNFVENIIKAYSSENWVEQIANIETLNIIKKEFSYVIISTYSTFSTRKFQNILKNLSDQTLLIADEMHNLGSSTLKSKLGSIKFKKLIGLSATPERQFQDEINKQLRVFFGENDISNYTYSYTMYDAIKKEPRALCQYKYFPVIVELTDEEFLEYIDLTRKINSIKLDTIEKKEIFNMFCIARQRVIHKAKNKFHAFNKIILDEYKKRGNLKYTLVYVPEGIDVYQNSSNDDNYDIYYETEEGIKLLDKYTKAINTVVEENISVSQFIGSTSSEIRNKILQDFAKGEIQVITSMKCLDEGIDVPRSELAIFCSSTGNPRQFIQRRGRVLRKCEGKEQATIYDLVVVPPPSDDPNLFKIEKNEIEKELRRIKDFAEMSENKFHTRIVLEEILKKYNLDL